MSKPANFGPSYDARDTLGDILDIVGKIVMYLGLIAMVSGAGFLTFYYIHLTSQLSTTVGVSNINMFSKVLMFGAIGAGLATMYLYWGEEFLIATQIIVAGLLFFAPMYLPVVTGISTPAQLSLVAADQIQKGGVALGVIALIGLLGEVGMRIRLRLVEGARSEQLKFGRGVVEEKHQNKFLGKCWQLPFCRKFVRERCPIYHAKRTCWKERVGCMCEEEVISNAMQSKAIPKDAVAAARYIPVNNKITAAQKRARCKQCVIYNEHLKHKYKLALPLTVAAFLVLYVVFRGPMLGMSGAAISQINTQLSANTGGQAAIREEGVVIFREILVDCIMFVALAYVLKLLEFFIFKLKV